MNNSLLINKKILNISRYEYCYFLNKANVVGVGLGYKVINGFCTFRRCIKVFVSSKVCRNKLKDKDILPKFYKGIEVDVVSTGYITSSSLKTRIRPVVGGYSISPIVNMNSSTMGCLVKNKNSVYLLGTNHGLAGENSVPLKAPILQPGVIDGGKNPEDVIAILSKYIILEHEKRGQLTENYVDCALGKITNKSLVSPKIAFIGRIKGVSAPALGEYVYKVGQSTELTEGMLTEIGITIIVNFTKGRCLFKDQISTSRMSDIGDSGALLLDEGKKALGLLFGASTSKSFFNPIETILDVLRVSIIK